MIATNRIVMSNRHVRATETQRHRDFFDLSYESFLCVSVTRWLGGSYVRDSGELFCEFLAH